MASKADRKRNHRAARKPAGSSAAGRPRQEGDRYPSGKLKPAGPNPRLVQAKRALVGERVDISKAENPLDLAHARQWLTDDEHRAGKDYASLYVRAGMNLPRIKTANLPEAGDKDGERAPQPGLRLRPEWMDKGDPLAMATLRLIWARLSSAQQRELLNVCVLDSWPQWVIWRAMGKEVPETWDRRRRDLLAGLSVVLAVVARPRPKPPTVPTPAAAAA